MDIRIDRRRAALDAQLARLEKHVPINLVERRANVEAEVKKYQILRRSGWKGALLWLVPAMGTLSLPFLYVPNADLMPIVTAASLIGLAGAGWRCTFWVFWAMASDAELENFAEQEILPQLLNADEYHKLKGIVGDHVLLAPYVTRWMNHTGGVLTTAELDLLDDAAALEAAFANVGNAGVGAALLRELASNVEANLPATQSNSA